MADHPQTSDTAPARILRGLLAGVMAGAAASFAMDRFQALTKDLVSAGDDDAEPATQKAAQAVVSQVGGGTIAKGDKPLSGQLVHYALGIGLGAAYGVAAEFRPSVTTGYGSVFGAGTATLLDEAAVPAVGLGDAPWKADPATTLYGYASHLVFGMVGEAVRRQVRNSMDPTA